VVAGAMGLDEAYKIARENKEKAEGVEAQLARLRNEDPELADKVIEGETSRAGRPPGGSRAPGRGRPERPAEPRSGDRRSAGWGAVTGGSELWVTGPSFASAGDGRGHSWTASAASRRRRAAAASRRSASLVSTPSKRSLTSSGVSGRTKA